MKNINTGNMLSILIPNKNGSKTIAKCINSLLNNICQFSYEILVIDGNSKDNSKEIIREISKNYQQVKLIDNTHETVPWALNLGINNSIGDYILIASAHSEYPKNYIQTLVELCISTKADCVGAIGKTLPRDQGLIAEAISYVLSDKLGVGNSTYRIGVEGVKEVDTVAYGCYPRSTFQKYGLFDTRLVRNQDLEFNKRIINNSGKILLTPNTYFIYYSRSNFKDLFQNNYGNGYWSIITPFFLKSFKTESLRHYVPFIFVLSLILSIIFSLVNTSSIYLSFAIACIYLFIIVIRSIFIAIRKGRIALIIPLIISFIVLHFSYGFGSLYAFLIILFNRKKLGLN